MLSGDGPPNCRNNRNLTYVRKKKLADGIPAPRRGGDRGACHSNYSDRAYANCGSIASAQPYACDSVRADGCDFPRSHAVGKAAEDLGGTDEISSVFPKSLRIGPVRVVGFVGLTANPND
jgi:hypothetical protein